MKQRNNKWVIAYKPREADLFDTSKFITIEPPPDTYQADPFVVEHKNETYIFHEWYDYDKGRIAFQTLDSGPEVVLDLPTHCSFPAIFQDGDQFFMTPETTMEGQLNIYWAKNFPYDWELVNTVAIGRYADPTLFFHEGYYRIYTTIDHNDLRIFTGKTLDGLFNLTYAEGIVHSRSAGQIFEHNGRLIRPVQDCQDAYGRATIFKDLQTGKEVGRIEPTWRKDINGTHTFNFSDNWVVVDGRIPLK